MEVSKPIPTVFMHFDMEFSNPEIEWQEICWWFVKQERLFVNVRPR